MDQKIFTLGLSVGATSLYLVLDALGAGASPAGLDAAAARWNETGHAFAAALDELESCGVIRREGESVALTPAAGWRAVA